MEGTRCHYPNCKIHDFLPFQCEYCHGIYCLEHRSRFNHPCQENFSDNQLKQTSIDSSKPTVSELFYAVEHRFDNETKYNPNEHFPIKSSRIEEDELTINTINKMEKLENVAGSSNSTRNINIANKTKQMLFKNRAIGNDRIASEDRFYLEINFLCSGESKFMFFPKYSTVGEVLEYLSNCYTLLSYRTPSRPTDLSLTLFHSISPPSPLLTPDEVQTILLSCDRNQPISAHFEEFSTLYLLPVPITAVIEAQSKLQGRQSIVIQEDPSPAFSMSTPPPSLPSLEPSASHDYVVGDSICYTPTNNLVEEIWYGYIVAVHRDDILPYYTIRIMNLISGTTKEKQTNSSTLQPSHLASNLLPADESFSVKFSYQGKTYPNNFIPRNGNVLSLKIGILQSEGLSGKGLHIFNLKLIYKGKILKNNDMLLKGKELNIVDNGTIMIMKENIS